ncbi:hypothetical protein BHM03_00030855 [Ensete ventricosum]|nr:hypothetical protein BHM03_00030855 [Ensete ventricosum]
MELIELLAIAGDFDFLRSGKDPTGSEMAKPIMGILESEPEDDPTERGYASAMQGSVLRAAIKYGSKDIAETIVKMIRGDHPVLTSWLFVQHRRGMVAKIVPKELTNNRNREEKTAQELFTEKHQKMFNNCRSQLIEMGKTCSGLLAAVVFASSFSIPGEKDPKTGNPVYFHTPAFKVFSHAYVIGLSCAVTSLVLFLSLVISPYSQRQFRLAIPVKYFFAILSFAMALLALMVSVIHLQHLPPDLRWAAEDRKGPASICTGDHRVSHHLPPCAVLLRRQSCSIFSSYLDVVDTRIVRSAFGISETSSKCVSPIFMIPGGVHLVRIAQGVRGECFVCFIPRRLPGVCEKVSSFFSSVWYMAICVGSYIVVVLLVCISSVRNLVTT